ncbi:hypothetical protein BOTU111921_12370 [Bordetella tumbae]
MQLRVLAPHRRHTDKNSPLSDKTLRGESDDIPNGVR